MILFNILLWFYIVIISKISVNGSNFQSEFTCQGTTLTGALTACVDQGTQLMSNGGNVTILVKSAKNLPNRDNSGPAAGVSDPYVKFTAGSGSNIVTASTRNIRNDLNPVWNEYISLGYLGSATQIKIEIWDKDTGLEFGDDLLTSANVRVPFCSTFYAKERTYDCGKLYGCEVYDSLWRMPTRKMCNESGSINFTPTLCSKSNAMCLDIEFYIIPFTMQVEIIESHAVMTTPLLSSDCDTVPLSYTSTNNFGSPYINDPNILVYTLSPYMKNIKGALMFRMNNNVKYKGKAEEILYYASTNFPAKIYICRYVDDNANGIPNWLTRGYDDKYVAINQIVLANSLLQFGCFEKTVPGTPKNKYGGIKSGLIPFYTNTIVGHDSGKQGDVSFYSYNYIALSVPIVLTSREDRVTIIYDASAFVSMSFSYGLVLAWFVFLIAKFLAKIKYRLDRVTAYLSTRVLTGEHRSLMAGLFLINKSSRNNIEYRAHLFHARNIYYFIFSIPFWLLFSFGFSCLAVIRPQGLGLMVVFLGSASLFFTYGFLLWKENNWRLSPYTILSIGLSVLFVIIFLLSLIFADPGVTEYNFTLNFIALSLVFGTMNSVPLMFLAFKQDRSQSKHLSTLLIKIASAVSYLKTGIMPKIIGNGMNVFKDLKVNKLLHSLLGETYTINPQVPVFSFSSALIEIPQHDLSTIDDTDTSIDREEKELLLDEKEAQDNEARRLYNISLITLFIYMIIALARNCRPSLAFLNCCSLILLDIIHLSISHGDSKWTPGFMILLLVVGRILVMSSPPSLWILNYGATYIVYASLLTLEMINTYLPYLNLKQAGNIAFGGAPRTAYYNHDIAGTPFFNLSLLTLCYIAILVIAVLGVAGSSELPTPNLVVLGWEGWNVCVFGLCALLFVIVSGLLFATIRAFYLDSEDLLRGTAKSLFLIRETITLPVIFACTTELSILVSGFLIYGATGAAAVLVGAFYLPLIMLTHGYAYYTWLSNDYELVPWPRRMKSSDIANMYNNNEGGIDGKSDLEVAFNMIENLFGNEINNDDILGNSILPGGGIGKKKSTKDLMQLQNIEDNSNPATEEQQVEEPSKLPPPTKNLKGFLLPELKVTGNKVDDIKMPPLPLKSVLRKKRKDLGIKTKTDIVKDLRSRDGAVDDDKFGNSTEVIDTNDPWVMFEKTEAQNHIVRSQARKRRLRNTNINSLDHILKNKYLIMLKSSIHSCIQLDWLPQQIKKYLNKSDSKVVPKKYSAEDIDGDEVDIDDDDDELNVIGDFEGTRSKSQIKKKPLPKQSNQEADHLKSIEEGSLDEESSLLFIDIDKLSFYDASINGYLTKDEYKALFSWYLGLILIFFFGITLSVCVNPPWIGNVIWVSVIIFICTLVIFMKYFNTYRIDNTSLDLAKFVAVLHVLFCIIFFTATLQSDPGLLGSLWILDFFIYYPLFLYIIYEIYKWYDSNFKFTDLDADHDGQVTTVEMLNYLRASPVIIAAIVILNWQFYIWISVLIGQIFTLVLIVGVITYIYLRDWSTNDFFLSPELISFGSIAINITLFITFCIAFLRSTETIFPVSVFCFTLQFKYLIRILQHYVVSDKETSLYFSTFVFPVYSYDSKTQDVIEQSTTVLELLYVLLIGVVWGIFFAIFYYPIDIGIAISCCFLLIVATCMALAATSIPLNLANITNILTPEGIIEAANAAKEKYEDRISPINLEIRGWDKAINTSDIVQIKAVEKTSLEKLKVKSSLANALDLVVQIRLLKYVRHIPSNDTSMDVSNAFNNDDDDINKDLNVDIAEKEISVFQQLWIDTKDTFKMLLEMLPFTNTEGYTKHSQGTFGFKDALMEAFITGKGPFGFLFFDGYFYHQIIKLRDSDKYSKYYPKSLDNYDEFGNNLLLVQLSEDLDIIDTQRLILNLDEALSYTFELEFRCAVHFILMLLVQADVKLQREKVLFQKFLRENRFRLASNEITPPPEIFSSASFASVNIPLVAAWLNTLSVDEYERFYMLKQTFSIEQADRDELIDNADYQLQFDAISLQNERKTADKYWSDKLQLDIITFKEHLIQEFLENLQGVERQRFLNKKDLWAYQQDCYVEIKDMDLYKRFRKYCFQGKNFNVDCVQATIDLIEQAQKDIRLGEYGRAYQYVDSDFVPSETSIGQGESAQSVLGWRCAPGINEDVMLFDGGTHPDYVVEGVFQNTWLISAINMLVAAGDLTSGAINPQIKALFVEHKNIDGEKTLATEVGAYCIQLYRNHEWTPIIIDDLFPMRKTSTWTNENRGLATAHNRECKGIWLPLIEKAFAKYFGSYTYLEKGFVHQALQDLTGCEAECIPLAAASRGTGKRVLWETLVKYRYNGYILGAGTGESSLADKEIQDMGIVFNSAYTIYDIQEVQGHLLLKLRNPPGDHSEWAGDWSDNSFLWNRKLKKKMGFTDDSEDNTFYMSFDDFCNVFRYLYICKYYSPKKWIETALPGIWRKANMAEVEKLEVNKQLMNEMADEGGFKQSGTQAKKEEQKRIKAFVDCAGGLPSKHNPGCILENNPYYSFRIHRPTDFRISVTQYTNDSRSILVTHPITILLTKCKHSNDGHRLDVLHKSDILFSTGEPVAQKTLCLYGSDLAPDLYIILVGTYLKGMEGHFKVSILTNHKVEFLPVWPPAWVLKEETQDSGIDNVETSIVHKNLSDKEKKLFHDKDYTITTRIKTFFQSQMKVLLGSSPDDDVDDDIEKNKKDDDDDDEDEEDEE